MLQVPAAPAFAGVQHGPASPIARIKPPPGVPSDVAIWRIIHGTRAKEATVSCLSREDHAEFAALDRDAACRARATRALLRHALSAAVKDELAPHAWRFERTSLGKPLVADGLPVVHFSTTHTRGVSLIATSRDARVGLDAEAHGISGWQVIADDMFTRRERAMLNNAPESAREETFLRIWTAREAHAKLIGAGLGFDVAANDCGPGTHLATWLDEGPSARVVLTLAVNHSANRNGNGGKGATT